MDISLAHTFEDPKAKLFSKNKHKLNKKWQELAAEKDCMLLLNKENLAGIYVLKGAEIEWLAVAEGHRGKKLGTKLLRQAILHIFQNSLEYPHTYCIQQNPKAVKFYQNNNMKITGYSGFACYEKVK